MDNEADVEEHHETESTGSDEVPIQFTDLPVDVLRVIVDLGGYPLSRSLAATSRHFCNVSRHLYWKLNKTYSLKYYDDEAFRTVVHSRVENPSKQLSLNLTRCSTITDVGALGGVHTLDLSGCGKITDVSALGGVHTLDLRRCSNIIDVSALGGVHSLYLSYCEKITDVSAIGGVHTLILYNCSNIIDVSALGGVHTLDLIECEMITDVNAWWCTYS